MKLAEWLSDLPRLTKWLVLLAADTVIFMLSILGAMVLRLDSFRPVSEADTWWAVTLVVPFALLLQANLGLYRLVIRFLSLRVFALSAAGVLGSTVFFIAVTYFMQLSIPRSVPIIFSFLAFLGVTGIRVLASFLLVGFNKYKSGAKVAIYGAGASGQQLLGMLRMGSEYAPAVFLDDDEKLWGRSVMGMPVLQPNTPLTQASLKKYKVAQVLLALPSATRGQRKKIIESLEDSQLMIRTVPGLEQMIEGGMSLDQIQDVRVEDLLGRDSVPANTALLGKCIQDKTVLVSGAGGSIGSELCRQVAALGAKQILLLEQSEFGLYSIEAELKGKHPKAEIIPLLADVANRDRVEKIFASYRIDTVYHAAAYKHVPLVEHNPAQGVVNNTFGTLLMAQAAKRAGVNDFVLISTDKAVRPTNVMGASKRVSEIVLQALYADSPGTRFSMVRFGNVLGSSGSVVPRFREQIAAGGPITVTHPDINRFFMTIPEAVELVIQAGAMAEGGDVFVLDMGKPVKIVDLARRMVHLSGLEVRDEAHPDGDIEIVYSGLRPGEKLYEELLIGDNVLGTAHPKIMRAEEEFMPWGELQAWLQRTEKALDAHDIPTLRELLLEAVGGYKPHEVIEDWLWQQGMSSQGVLH